MIADVGVLGAFLAIFMSGLVASVVRGDAGVDPAHSKYEQDLEVTATASKAVYRLGEAVPIALTISNNSQQSVYTFNSESDFATGFATVRDASGRQIMGDPIPTPPASPPSHHMMRNGKIVHVVPIYEIKSHGVMKATIADVLRLHHKHLTEGTYDLDFGSVTVIHEAGNLIVRKDVPHRLWVDPSSPMTKVRHKLGTVRIEIQGKLEDEVPPRLETRAEPEHQPPSTEARQVGMRPEPKPTAVAEQDRILLPFIGIVAVTTCVLFLVLLLRRRLGGR